MFHPNTTDVIIRKQNTTDVYISYVYYKCTNKSLRTCTEITVSWGGFIVVFSAVQVAIAQINEQIGAAGVVNHECKQVVAGYGIEMVELLKAQVRAIPTTLLEKRMHSVLIEATFGSRESPPEPILPGMLQ